MVNLNPPPFTFIIDTDSYGGNFERKLCAYVTGVTGECTVGEDVADLVAADLQGYGLGEIVMQVPDDNGCRRPVSIGGIKGCSVEIYFDTEPSAFLIDMFKRRSLAFAADPRPFDKYVKPFKITRFRLVKRSIAEETIISDAVD
jgi:hypothetical protein